jgi:hypothetical protein
LAGNRRWHSSTSKPEAKKDKNGKALNSNNNCIIGIELQKYFVYLLRIAVSTCNAFKKISSKVLVRME